MEPGKVPPEVLERIVYANLGKKDPAVLLGPGLGEDAALIQVGDKVIVASTDPITGSIEDVGWLAVHANANDIATFGVPPRWFLASVMLPSGYKPEDLGVIMQQIDDAAKQLDIAVVGGHSEITERINQPIVTGFMIGMTEIGNYVTSHDAQPSNDLIMTKTAAPEGTSILATEGYSFLSKHLDDAVLRDAKRMREKISVTKEGVAAYRTGFVSAMHDPTEGGIANGIHELCDASGVGIELDYDSISIAESTMRICEILDVDPLELISSGCMLICCDNNHSRDVMNALDAIDIESNIIGSMTRASNYRKVRKDGKLIDLKRPKTDALWSALKKVNPS